jgi:hypothetical protein
MLTSVEGIYRDGKIELLEPSGFAEGSRVVVTLLPENGPIDLRSVGIDEEMAGEIRDRFASFADDWDRPDMDVYNDL